MTTEENSKQDEVDELVSRASVLLAISIANWPTAYKIVQECTGGSPEEQSRLDQLSAEARSEALLLLSLQRALEDHAPILEPITRALAASYAIVALAVEADEINIEALLSPEDIPSLLSEEGRRIIKEHGGDEAVRRLEEDQSS